MGFAFATMATSVAVTAAPLALGWGVGRLLRLRGGRRGGIALVVVALVVPVAALVGVDVATRWIGIWDAALAGALLGGGVLLSLHRAFARRTDVAVLLGSCSIGLLFLEIACRFALPPPPAFPSSQGPSLFLVDAVRTAQRTGHAPVATGRAVCHAIYGEGKFVQRGRPNVFPATWEPRVDARSAVLHLGDSMVYGGPEGRFTADLTAFEPDVEHVNASIAGVGPDVYLSLLRLFVERHEFSAVVMHLTPNDYFDVDTRQYPCTAGQSLLVYESTGTRLRFSNTGARLRFADTGLPGGTTGRLRWLVRNSPPPYVLRAGVRRSAFAAHLASLWVELVRSLSGATISDAVREEHIEAIMRDARDLLYAREIPFVVDLFRDRGLVESGIAPVVPAAEIFHDIAAGLGIVTLDTRGPLTAAVRRGVPPFTNAGGPADPHFNAAGHALIAEWLHEQLPAAIAQSRSGSVFRPGTAGAPAEEIDPPS